MIFDVGKWEEVGPWKSRFPGPNPLSLSRRSVSARTKNMTYDLWYSSTLQDCETMNSRT